MSLHFEFACVEREHCSREVKSELSISVVVFSRVLICRAPSTRLRFIETRVGR